MTENLLENKKFIKIVVLVCSVLLIAIGSIGTLVVQSLFKKDDINTAYISGKLEDISELATQRLTYSNVRKESEGKIPIIAKKGFTMSYTGEIKAGIDFSSVDVKVQKSVVEIDLPRAKVLSIKIDPSSVEFYDSKFSLFKWNNKDDVTEAIAAAEKADLENENADYTELIERADENAEKLLRAIFEGNIGGRDLIISFK